MLRQAGDHDYGVLVALIGSTGAVATVRRLVVVPTRPLNLD